MDTLFEEVPFHSSYIFWIGKKHNKTQWLEPHIRKRYDAVQSWEAISPVTIWRQRRLFKGLCPNPHKALQGRLSTTTQSEQQRLLLSGSWSSGLAQRDAASSPRLLWSCLHPTSQHVAAEISRWWLGTDFAPNGVGHLRALLLWLRCRLCCILLHHSFLGDDISSPAVMLQLYQVCLHNHIHIPWAKVPGYKVKCEPVTSVCKEKCCASKDTLAIPFWLIIPQISQVHTE